MPADSRKLLTRVCKDDISKCLSLLFGKLKLCIFLSLILLCLLQPTAKYDLAIIEDYLAGNAKIKISIKKQNGVVVIFSEPWQLLLTGSAVPRIVYVVYKLIYLYVVSAITNLLYMYIDLVVILSDFINLTQVHNFTVCAQDIITFRRLSVFTVSFTRILQVLMQIMKRFALYY